MRLPIPCGDINDVIANIDWKLMKAYPAIWQKPIRDTVDARIVKEGISAPNAKPTAPSVH
jgi:hypothetical protein